VVSATRESADSSATSAPRALASPPPQRIDGYLQAEKDPLLGTATTLRYHVEFPDPSVWGNGPYPTVMDYSGYGPGTVFFDGLGSTFKAQGYAVIGVNIRGTGCSGGKFDYFEPVQSSDGYDAVEYAAAQYWSTGDVAMVGKSYPGITQAFVAEQRPLHLRAIVPGAIFGDLYRDVPYPGGIQNVAFSGLWSVEQPFNGGIDQQWQGLTGSQKGFFDILGVPDPTKPTDIDPSKNDPVCTRNQADHATNPLWNPFVQAVQPQNQWYSDFFKQRSPDYTAGQINVPVMLEAAWQDEEVGSRGSDLIRHLAPGVPYRMLLQNGDHGEYYNAANIPEIYRFLSYYVKKQVPLQDQVMVPVYAGRSTHVKSYRPITYAEALAGYQAEPRVLVNWELGKADTPSWQTRMDAWYPSATAVDRLYLQPDGRLSPVPAPASTGLVQAGVSYTYAGGTGQSRGTNIVPSSPGKVVQFPGPLWQYPPPSNTYAAFTTDPFAADQEFLGPASADLWVSSTAVDTDFEVLVTDLREDGREEYVQKGWLRASHRALDPEQTSDLRPYQTHVLTDTSPLVPGQPTPVRIEIFPLGQVFRAHDRLRVYVEAPNLLPEYWGFAALPAPAENTIYTDAAHPSSLALPLIPGAVAEALARSCDGTGDWLRNQPCRTPAPGNSPIP
jgi:predicted acyl esterase